MPTDVAAAEEGAAWQTAADELGLLDAVGADVDLPSFLAGESTPVFVGSALTNFGVRLLLDAVIDLAPPPSPRLDVDGEPRPLDAPFSAFVFKVQANMDPSHRDRIAFARICSGRFERGMARDPRPHRHARSPPSTPPRCSAPERETIDEAFPGDVVGLVNATDLQLGDTLHAGDAGDVPADPAVRARALRHRPAARHRPVQAVPQGPRPSSTRRAWCRCCATPTRRHRAPILAAVGAAAVRGVRPTGWAASSARRPRSCRAPYQAIRLHRQGSRPTRLRDIGGIRILRAVRRRARRAVREPLPPRTASRPTSPS